MAACAVPPTSLTRACQFLCAQQSRDGAWRSRQYGAFREGDALTPLVLCALQRFPGPDRATAGAIARGVEWLRNLARTQKEMAEPWRNLAYPLFTAAYAAQIFARECDAETMKFWLKIVHALRIRPLPGPLSEALPSGAWGDATEPSEVSASPAQIPDMIAPNISATLLALDALTAAREHTSARAALPFITRCQNFSETARTVFDDGGFFYAIDDPVRNKAGISGIDDTGRARYRSYGSATCDGILAMRAAGAEWNEPRCRAALRWLARETHDAVNAGDWPISRQDTREGLIFYHAQTFARVLASADEGSAAEPVWITAQRNALRADLTQRQRPDGAWSGAQPDSCEDDPLVATSFALRALVDQ
jgi:hypothetical protein